MKDEKTLDEKLCELAAAHDNVVSRPELQAIKFSDQMIATQLARRRWQTLHAGVYLIGAAEPTWQQRCRAALKAAGEGAQLPGETGLAVLGVDGAKEGKVHVVVPTRMCPRIKGVVVHRTTVPDSGHRGGPMSMCSVPRLLIDFAAKASVARVEDAVESAISQGLTHETRIWRALAELSHRMPGVARLTRVMEERPEGKAARSKFETQLLRVVRRADLPTPVRNHDVYVDGKHYEIDLAYPEVLGAIEADSRRYHSTKTKKARDKARQDHLESVGYRFKRFTWRDVLGRPQWVVEEIRELLACANLQAEGAEMRKRAG